MSFGSGPSISFDNGEESISLFSTSLFRSAGRDRADLGRVSSLSSLLILLKSNLDTSTSSFSAPSLVSIGSGDQLSGRSRLTLRLSFLPMNDPRLEDLLDDLDDIILLVNYHNLRICKIL
jgi:hypothetical protein